VGLGAVEHRLGNVARTGAGAGADSVGGGGAGGQERGREDGRKGTGRRAPRHGGWVHPHPPSGVGSGRSSGGGRAGERKGSNGPNGCGNGKEAGFGRFRARPQVDAEFVRGAGGTRGDQRGKGGVEGRGESGRRCPRAPGLRLHRSSDWHPRSAGCARAPGRAEISRPAVTQAAAVAAEGGDDHRHRHRRGGGGDAPPPVHVWLPGARLPLPEARSLASQSSSAAPAAPATPSCRNAPTRPGLDGEAGQLREPLDGPGLLALAGVKIGCCRNPMRYDSG
jgi:hypothetical protein